MMLVLIIIMAKYNTTGLISVGIMKMENAVTTALSKTKGKVNDLEKH